MKAERILQCIEDLAEVRLNRKNLTLSEQAHKEKVVLEALVDDAQDEAFTMARAALSRVIKRRTG